MSESVVVGPVTAPRGSKAFGFLDVCTMADGAKLRLPVHIIAGSSAGPGLCVICGQHGNEIKPITVLRSLVGALNCKEMAGHLILVPVANPVAFEMGSRSTWMDALFGDGGNLNRVWPGSSTGWLSERIAHRLAKHVIPQADFVIDLHDGFGDFSLCYGYSFKASGDLDKRATGLAMSLGMEIMVRANTIPGALSDYVLKSGIPVTTCEVGDIFGLAGQLGEAARGKARPAVEVGTTAITNVMKHLGLLPGTPALPARRVLVSDETRLSPAHGGLLFSNVGREAVGTIVPKDTVLGAIVSPYSFEEIDAIAAPYDENLILAVTETTPCTRVNPGGYAYYVADWSTAEWLT